MAHKKAAIKHLRQTKKRTGRNRAVKERVKDAIKNLARLCAAKNAAEARAALPILSRILDKAAKEHIIHRNRANRLKSAWAKRINALK